MERERRTGHRRRALVLLSAPVFWALSIAMPHQSGKGFLMATLRAAAAGPRFRQWTQMNDAHRRQPGVWLNL